MFDPIESQQSSPRIRLDALTGMRWLAAFMVFFFHLRVFSPLPGPITAVFDQGYLGVTFFFVLSGFVLTWSQASNVSISTFYWRRFARIYPSAIVALLFAIPVFYNLGVGFDTEFFDLKQVTPILLLSFVLLQGWWSNPAIFFSGNPAAWTLTFEMFFYLCHPYIFNKIKGLSVRGLVFISFLVILLMFIFRYGVIHNPESFLTYIPGPITRITEFIFGMLLALLSWKSKFRFIPIPLGLFGILLVVALVTLSGHYGIPIGLANYNNELFTASVGVAIYAIASSQIRGVNTMLSASWLVKLGEISFAFYLIHATVIYLALRLFGYQPASWSNILWILAIFTIDLFLAFLLHQFVEKPLEKRMRSWKDRRDNALNASSLSSD